MGHGPRLSDDEYQARIVELHEVAPERPTPEQQANLERAEFELTVDHRLGTEFPAERRESLWEAHRRSGPGKLRFLLAAAFGRVRPRGLRRLARGLVREYAKVLSEDELEAYFGAEEVRDPRLP